MTTGGTADVTAPKPVRTLTGALALLFFRPSRYVRECAPRIHGLLVPLMILLYGLALAVEGLSRRSPSWRSMPFDDTWSSYWTVAAILALGAGPVLGGFGAWWFQCRLLLCRVHPVDSGLAIRAWASAQQIFALPILLVRLGETLFFHAPSAVNEAWGRMSFVTAFFGVWAWLAQYRSVRAAFGGRARRVVFWFLAFPILLPMLLLTLLYVAFA